VRHSPQENLARIADFNHGFCLAIEYSGISDKTKSLCPGYVVNATLKKRNEAGFFREDFRFRLGILHLGRSTGQSIS
jgi:hypothetical protein